MEWKTLPTSGASQFRFLHWHLSLTYKIELSVQNSVRSVYFINKKSHVHPI